MNSKEFGGYLFQKTGGGKQRINMRILVTGGSGFIGTNYIDLLLKENSAEFINPDLSQTNF
jgi:FlaA1/EpsC-like NDP-sugar epimerase